MKIFITYISLLVFSISTYSQDSIFNYLEIAAKNNPTVIQKLNEYKAAMQKTPQVGSLPDPELNVGVFLSPMELMNGKQVADIKIMQMFPWFGVLKNAKDEMSLMAKAKYETFVDAKLQVYFNVQRTWFELYKNQQYIRFSEKNLEILRTLERLALIKYKSSTAGVGNSSLSSESSSTSSNQNASSGQSGMNSMSVNNGSNQSTVSNPSAVMQTNAMGSASTGSGLVNLYRIQLDINELVNNISLLKNQQNTITAKLNSLLNRPATAMVSLPDTLNPDTLKIALHAVSDSMLSNNPMLNMLQQEQLSLDARKKMVTRMGYPMVGLGLNYSLINKSEMSTSAMNGEDMIMPMVTITLPIYRKKYKAMQIEADLMKSASEQNYEATSKSLETDYYEAMQLYYDSQRRIKLYINQNQLSEKSLEIMIKSFSASGSGLNDILQIRQQMLNYEFKQVEALVDFNTSIAWLNRLMASNRTQGVNFK
jgi:outer membrane protein TolC